jgi:hypothetical protein
MGNTGRNTNVMQTTSESYSLPSPAISELPAIINTSVGIVNETINGGDIAGVVPIPPAKMVSPVPTTDVQSIQPDIFTNISNTIIAHPGLVFFMGCLFVIALSIIMDYRRKRKN